MLKCKDKVIHLRNGRWQSNQVQIQPADQGNRICECCRQQVFCFKLRQDETVDRIGRCVSLGQGRFWNCRFLRCNKGPMLVVSSTLRNPFSQDIFLNFRQRLARLMRRHNRVVGGKNPKDQFAFVRLARLNRHLSGIKLLDSALHGIETQASFAFCFIKSMTGKTVFGQDRTNIAVVFKAVSTENNRAQYQPANQRSVCHAKNRKN